MLLADSGFHPVPQVGLQADQVTKQTDQIDRHRFTLAHIDSMECKCQQLGPFMTPGTHVPRCSSTWMSNASIEVFRL